jgi:ParB family chromosome partitioning protein
VIAERLSVRQTEALVATGVPTPAKSRIRKDPAHAVAKSPHLVELEQHLHQRFGTAVLIRSKSAEKGQFIIDYNNQEDFDRVCSLIRGG